MTDRKQVNQKLLDDIAASIDRSDRFTRDLNTRSWSQPSGPPGIRSSGITLPADNPAYAHSEDQDPGNPLTWVIDKLQRGLYGVSNVVKEATKSNPSTLFDFTGLNNVNIQRDNPVEAFGKGWSGEVKTTGKDIAEGVLPKDFGLGSLGLGSGNEMFDKARAESGGGVLGVQEYDPKVRDAVKGTFGIGWDLAADPLNLLGVGPVARVVEAGVGAAGKGIKAVTGTTARDVARTAPLEKLSGKAAEEAEAFRKSQIGEEQKKQYGEMLADELRMATVPAGHSPGLFPEEEVSKVAAKVPDSVKASAKIPDVYQQGSLFDVPTGQLDLFDVSRLPRSPAKPEPFPEVQPPEMTPAQLGQKPLFSMKTRDELGRPTPVETPVQPEPALFETSGKQTIKPEVPKEAAVPTGPVEGQKPLFAQKLLKELDPSYKIPRKPKEVSVAAAPANAERRATIGDTIAEQVAPAPRVAAAQQPSIPRHPKSNIERSVRNQTDDAISATKIYSDQAKAVKIKTADRAQYMADNIIPHLEQIKNAKAAQGIYPVVKSGDNAYYIDISDIYKGLGDDFKKFHLSTKGKNIPPSAMTAGVAKLMDSVMAGLSREDTLAAVRQAVETGHKVKSAPEKAAVTQFSEALFNHTNDFVKLISNNEHAFGLKDTAQGIKIGEDVAAETLAKIADPKVSVAENLQDVANINGKVKAKSAEEGVGPAGTIKAAETAMKGLKGKVTVEDVGAARTALANSRDIVRIKDESILSQKVIERIKMQSLRDATKIVDDLGPYRFITDINDVVLDNGVQRFLQVIATKMKMGHGTEVMSERMRNLVSASLKEQAHFDGLLSQVSKLHDKGDIYSAYTALRALKPLESIKDAKVAAAYEHLRPLLEEMHSLSEDLKDIIADSAFSRENVSFDTLNEVFKEKGSSFYFDPKKAKDPTNKAEIFQQWRDHAPEDPLEHLQQMKAAQTTIAARKRFGEMVADLYGTAERTPNSYKFRPGKDKISPFLNTELNYPAEVGRMLSQFVKTYDNPTSFIGKKGGISWFMNNVVDPYLRIWKPLTTIARPGHHVRNAWSDFILNGMRGIISPLHYKTATNIKRALGEFEGDLAGFKKLYGEKPIPEAKDVAFHVETKDGSHPVSYSTIGQMGTQHGLIVSFRQSEDLLEKAATGIDKLTNKVMDTGWMKAMGRMAENENSYFRWAQYSALLRDSKFTSKFKNLDEASHAAITEVQRTHPDMHGLTTEEAKYGRRIIPFYTFFRQVVPTVFETLLKNPNRALVLPKAQYNLQVAMGYDPESLEDPFDPTRRYPSFINDYLSGPMKMFGGESIVNTGSPLEAVNDLVKGKGFASNVADMLNPLLAAPIELSTRNELVSEKYVTDPSEYLDRATPGFGLLGDIAATSPWGTIGNVLGGELPGLDPQRSRARNEKKIFLNNSTLNALFGLGYQDISKPSYNRFSAKETGGG